MYRLSDDYDIALMKLDSPVTYNSVISPVCLPLRNISLAIGRFGVVTGWVLNEKIFHHNDSIYILSFFKGRYIK